MPPPRIALLAALLFAGAVAVAQTTEPLEQAVDESVQGAKAGAESQLRVEGLDDETRVLFAEYRAALRQIESLTQYRDRLQQLVDDQQDEVARRQDDITAVATFERDLFPAMERMVDALAGFTAADVPFLPEERSARVARLRGLLTRSDVTASEKFRQVSEAFQVELDYGRTIEAYRGSVGGAGDDSPERVVDFLRIGRSALVYQTLDGAESAVWDAAAGDWRAADDYRADIRRGLRIARKQTAPDLLLLPFTAPVALEDVQ